MLSVLGNGVQVVNVTPHPINFMEPDGETVTTVPASGFVLNARPTEVEAESSIHGVKFVRTEFQETPEGIEFLNSVPDGVLVVGSMLAAQAYPGRVAVLTPFPGFERVAPPEKRMNTDKFTIF